MEKINEQKIINMKQAEHMYDELETRYQVIAPTARHIRMFKELPDTLTVMDIAVFHKLCTVKHLQQYTGRLIVDATGYPSNDPSPIISKDIVKMLPIKRTAVYDSLRSLCENNVFKRFAQGFMVNPLYATASPMVYANPERRHDKIYYNYVENGTGIDDMLLHEFGIDRKKFIELLADIPILCVPSEERQKFDDKIINDAIAAEKHRQDIAEGVIE